MMRLDCPSPPSCPSFSRKNCAQLPQDDCLLAAPSHHLNSAFFFLDSSYPSHLLRQAAPLERTISDHYSSVGWDSEKEPCVESITSVLSNATPASSKSSVELMKEISMLEVEILNMERYLLSLYRTAFRQNLPALLGTRGILISNCKMGSPLPSSPDHLIYDKVVYDAVRSEIDHDDREFHSCGLAGLKRRIRPVSMSSSRMEKMDDSSHRSLADHLSASRMDVALKFADKLSEEIIRCISSIYCRLANPHPAQKGFSASTSSTSSSSTFSPRNLSGSWSPRYNEEGKMHCEIEGPNEKGQYALTIEVLKLCLDDDSFKCAAIMLHKFRSLIKILERVDPKKMKREEKLAFWINIHNALVMHAYLAYGTQNFMRNISILKAAYNVGGLCVNANDIQHSILGIRSHYSAPWLQSFLSPGKKFRTGSSNHAYAIEYPEPLVHFALCSGAYSDPVVRVYSAENVFQDLRVAKKEFIEARVYTCEEARIYFPKILSHFAKDMSLDMGGVLEIVSGCLPEEDQQKAIKNTWIKGRRPEKHIHWLPSNSTFRYLIHKQVAPEIYD